MAAKLAHKSLFFFLTPLTQAVDFSAFASKKVTAQAKDNLKIVTAARNRMVAVMEHCQKKAVNSPVELRNALEDYLPYARAILHQLDACLTPEKNPAILPKAKFEFCWTSALVKVNGRQKRIKYKSMSDEVLQTYWLYGLMHYQMAAWRDNDLESQLGIDAAGSDEQKENSPIQWLKQAGGIFEYIATQLIPSMQSKLDDNRHWDVQAFTCEALALICQANMQEFAIEKALNTNLADKSFAPTTVAKLCLGAAKLFTRARTTLVAGATKKKYGDFRQSFREYIAAKEDYYTAMARMFLGRDATSNKKYGLAVAHHRKALGLMKGVKISETKNYGLLAFKEALLLQGEKMKKVHQMAADDNERVYYDAVPAEDTIKLPDGVVLAKLTPHEPAPLLDSSFFGVNPEKPGACIIS